MLLSNIVHTLYYISAGSVLAPLLLCVYKYRTLNRVLRVLFLYLLVSASVEVLCPLTLKYSMSHFFVLQNVFTLLEIALLLVIYLFHASAPLEKRILRGLLLTLLLFGVLTFATGGRMDDNDFLIKPVLSVVMIGLSIYNYFIVLRDLLRGTAHVEAYYFTFLNASVLIYFSTSFLYFVFGRYLETCPKPIFEMISILNMTANIVYNGLMAVSVWMKKT